MTASAIDFVVIVGYFLLVILIGLWASCRGQKQSISDYFLASRHMNWILVGASLYSSNTGSGQFVGLAGSGASSGIAISLFEFNAIYVLMLLGWLFVPVYMSSGIYTMPEYIQKRFGGKRIQIFLSFLALILSVFTKISADLYAGALFIGQYLNWNLYISIIILLIFSSVFTIAGGLKAVIYTDSLQTSLMVIGAMILSVKSFIAVGGYEELVTKFFLAEPNVTLYDQNNVSCGKAPPYSMNMFRDWTPGESDLPWTGMVFGLTVSAVWYWCTDQVIVQKTLSAKSVTHSKGGCILAGYIKLFPLFMLIFPGMVARILYPDEVACSVPELCEKICGSRHGCTNIAYPLLVIRLLPPGLSGMMFSVMLAALMSSLSSVFNSSSTLFTIDVWKSIRKNPSEMEMILVGRIFVLCLVAVSIIWVPVIEATKGSTLFNYIQSITSYLSPPVCAVFVLAIFWNRMNEKGAFWSLMLGLIVGLIRFGLEFGYTVPPCGSNELDYRPWFIKRFVGDIHYLNFGFLLFLFSIFVGVVVSYLTEPIPIQCLYRLTFDTKFVAEPRKKIDLVSESKISHSDTELSSSEELSQNLPKWKKILHFLCCARSQKKSDRLPIAIISPEEEARKAVDFLYEVPKWSRFVNINAVILMCLASFIIVYYM